MRPEEKRTYLFEAMPVPRAVASLAIPTVISSLIMVLYNLADTFFVGMLNDPVQNAAVTLVFPVILAFNAVNNLFGVGTSSMMSRSLGRGDYARVQISSVFGFYGAIFSGLLFSLVCTVFKSPLMALLGADETTREATANYMLWTVTFGAIPSILNVVQAQIVRSEGASMHASIGTMSGCILNIILDPVFILPWGLNMGAAGAGLATFVSNCVACLYFLVLVRVKRGHTFVSLDIRRLSGLSRDVVLGIMGVGVPSAIQNLLNVTGSTILNNFTSVYGAAAVAAMGIAHKVNMLPVQIGMGFGQGIMPLVSYNYASGNRKRMKNSILFSQGLVLPVMLLVTIGYWFGASALVRMFIDNADIIAYGTPFLRAKCIGMTFLCVDFLAVGVFQAIGRGRFALVFAILRKIVLEIPLMFLLNRLLPLYGLAFAPTIAEIILAIAAVVMLLRIFREIPEPSGA